MSAMNNLYAVHGGATSNSFGLRKAEAEAPTNNSGT